MRLTVGMAAVALLAGGAAHAQVADTTPRLSVFAGGVGSDGGSVMRDAEYGGSVDFHIRSITQALRASLTFRDGAGSMKVGTLSLDVVGRPLPSLFGLRPYLLGGLGVSSATSYSVDVPLAGAFDNPMTIRRSVSATTWAFVDAGGGVEIGRHFFVQTKLMVPVAGLGPALYPLVAGFRFSY